MKVFVYFLVVLVAVYAVEGDKVDDKCDGPNEVYVDCKIPCRPTCRTIIHKLPMPLCQIQEPCPSGCACQQGYVRNDDNICTKIEDCRKNT